MIFRTPVSEIEYCYKTEKNARAKQRLHVLLLRAKKYRQEDIAELVCVTQGTVSNVCARFKKFGLDSVYDKPRSGRPSKLTKVEKEKLVKRMSKPYAKGSVRRGWHIKDVMNIIRKEFKKDLSMRQVERTLHVMNMSWKVPRPEHKMRDEKAVHDFKKTSRGRYCLWELNMKSSA